LSSTFFTFFQTILFSSEIFGFHLFYYSFLYFFTPILSQFSSILFVLFLRAQLPSLFWNYPGIHGKILIQSGRIWVKGGFPMDDAAIIAALSARQEIGLDQLERTYGKMLQRFAHNILGNPHEAEECVNDTYLALWNAIPPEHPQPLAPYVFRVCRNLALKRLRYNTAQRRNGSYDLSLDELDGCLSGITLEDLADSRALGRAINAFLYTLDKENRILFLRRYWFGDSISQIALDRGMKENAVSVRLSRIRNKLRVYLSKEELL
jgi:RNA polymerase sigma-70 factor (ECF subfamily)